MEETPIICRAIFAYNKNDRRWWYTYGHELIPFKGERRYSIIFGNANSHLVRGGYSFFLWEI